MLANEDEKSILSTRILSWVVPIPCETRLYKQTWHRDDHMIGLYILTWHVVVMFGCGLALSHGLVLHMGLPSLHLSHLERIVQEKLLWLRLWIYLWACLSNRNKTRGIFTSLLFSVELLQQFSKDRFWRPVITYKKGLSLKVTFDFLFFLKGLWPFRFLLKKEHKNTLVMTWTKFK